MGDTRRARSRHGGLSVRAETPPRGVNSSRSRRRRSPTARVVVTGSGGASATADFNNGFCQPRNTSLLAGNVRVSTENSTTRPAQRGASAGRAAADAARRPVRDMSWLVDAAKSAADKAEAALQKLDKDGGEVVVAAKKELFASSDEPAAPAPPPQQLSRRQTGPRTNPKLRRDRVDSKPLDYAASPEPATVSSPPEATTQRRADDASLVDASLVAAKTGTAKPRTIKKHASITDDPNARRNARRLALLDHVAALVARRNAEASEAKRDAAAAREALAAEAAATSLRGDRAAGAADAAAARLRALRAERAAAQDSADARLAELAGVGGERARRLGAEQRALAFATRRRDDAADAVAAAERRVAAARDAEELVATRGARVSADASEASEAASAHLASVALIETNLRATRAAAEACRRRLAAQSSQTSQTSHQSSHQSSRSGDDAAADVSARGALESRLRRVADALFEEQSRCEALKSDKAALAFRLESARAETRRAESTPTPASAGAEGADGADADAEAWTDSELDDDDDVEASRFSRDGRGATDQNVTPKELAYKAVTFAFGPSARNERVAREVSEAVSALDRATLFALTAWGKTRLARAAFASYAVVMHAYVFALLWFGGSGPRATNTETATSVG